jgi:hypothetical protein
MQKLIPNNVRTITINVKENIEGAINHEQSRETDKTKKNKTKTQHHMC